MIADLEACAKNTQWPAPEAGFVSYVARTTRTPALEEVADTVLASANSDDGSLLWHEAPVLAAAGYLIGDLGSDGAARWRDGAARLMQRDPFPADRASFFFRPLELYGLARGALVIDHELTDWLREVFVQGNSRVGGDLWHRALAGMTATELGVSWDNPVTSRDVQVANVHELALLTWLAASEPEAAAAVIDDEKTLDGARKRLLDLAVTAQFDVDDAARAALGAVSIRRVAEDMLVSAHEEAWQLTRSERDAVQVVEHLCTRFPRYVWQLQRRHGGRAALAIADEYDLQDHLHALLRLHFDDVREEEWTPSYAGVSTRMDFLLKREAIVVETKMTRERLDERKLVAELLVDKEHYRKHPDCQTLICFIYDPDHRLKNPDAVIDDVSDDEPALRTLVVVSPRPS
jgi:hypothetical protein